MVGLTAAAAVLLAALLGFALGRQPVGGTGGRGEIPTEWLAGQPALGASSAPVTVVEFADFKCPYCRIFALEVFPRLRHHIERGQVRFYFLNYPFLGPDSLTAALAVEAVYAQDPDGVWPFMDALWRHQGPEQTRWATPELLVELARRTVPGLDAPRLAQDLQAGRYRDRVERDVQIAVRLGVRGTPAVFVQGRAVADWSYPSLARAIEAALADAPGEGAPR